MTTGESVNIRDPGVTREDRHRVAVKLIKHGLRSAETADVQAWYFPHSDDGEVYVGERDPNHYNNFRHSATYDESKLRNIVPHMSVDMLQPMPDSLKRELDDAVVEEYDPGERARYRALPANAFGEMESHKGKCGEYPLIDYNQASDLLHAEVRERIAEADDEKVEEELSDLFQTLFPAFHRTSPGDAPELEWPGLDCGDCKDTGE